MGALRVGKFAKHLIQSGHEVRILAGRDLPFPQTLPREVPEECVTYLDWADVNFLPKLVHRLRLRVRRVLSHLPWTNPRSEGALNAGSVGSVNVEDTGKDGGILRALLRGYMVLTNWPDPQIGYLRPLRKAGHSALRTWQPDLIFASAPPHTALIAAAKLARRYDVPWVAEYRDRWVEDPYGTMPSWRNRMERRQENRLLADVRGIVTVSEPWAEDYRARFGKPVEVVYNGFDPDDIPANVPEGARDTSDLVIVYTGILYPDRRDPTPLFDAVTRMGDAGKRVQMRFYGTNPSELQPLADRFGLTRQVEILPSVPYGEIIGIQRRADILLLLQWNNVLERGNVPGKLFEYIAARRPVLGIGYEQGVPAHILAEREAGLVKNDPDEIAAALTRWLAQKDEHGTIPPLPESVATGLSRPEQYARTVAFFERLIGQEKT